MASNLPASKSGLYADPREDWLALHSEDVIDPARRIVDPHHHLWNRGGQARGRLWRESAQEQAIHFWRSNGGMASFRPAQLSCSRRQ